MAIKSTGALSFVTDIVGEFADTAPHSMSEFYGGGDKVPAGANPGVATSGEINFNSFYDCVAATVLTISSNTNDYNIGAACIAAGGDKSTPVILTINSGVTVGSSVSSIPAMKTDTGWSNGTTITITNNGSIVGSSGSNSSGPGGAGGSGGTGGTPTSPATPYSGGSGSTGSGSAESANNGGNAFEHSQTADNYLSVTFDTAGTRTGGSAGTRTFLGGGGGGGGGNHTGWMPGRGAGGGGGGGANGGSGGGGGTGQDYNGNGCCSGGSGANGGATTGGGGGGGGSSPQGYSGGGGGSGGNLGNSGSGGGGAGSNGGSAGSSGNASGSAGSALSGNTGQIS
jgi:hypothetical protein